MKQKKYAYLVGIKGVAMAALAVYLSESGMRVTGSDVADEFPTDEELKKIQATIYTGFDADRIRTLKPDVVYYTGAHGGRDNPEVQAAAACNIPVFPHGQALGERMKGSRQIVVAGSHGKTTTSAMIATLMREAKLDPSYAIGCGSISSRYPAGHKGASTWFVAEGDEYVTDPHHDLTPRFLWTTPEIMVVTNIDFDHPDVYAGLSAVQDAFRALQKQATVTVLNADDANSRVLQTGTNIITYGYSPASDFRITHVGSGDERTFFRLEERGVPVGEFVLKVPGAHNVSNATAALVAAHTAGVDWKTLHEGLLQFTGTKRRFEKLGQSAGVTYYDDYAHHPAEIRATLAGARTWYPHQRIIAVFQPHTYSRTSALLPEFARAFQDADMVVLTDIYASAREHDTLGLDGMTLVSSMRACHRDVRYGKDYTEIHAILSAETHPGDVVICMGAGDIYTWGKRLLHDSVA